MRKMFARNDDPETGDVDEPDGLDEIGDEGQPVAGPAVCPECGSAERVPLEYGFPTHEMWEAAERGEIGIGGCVIFEGQPDVQCRNCSTQYNTESGQSLPDPWQ